MYKILLNVLSWLAPYADKITGDQLSSDTGEEVGI
jgi:hypothetical protein